MRIISGSLRGRRLIAPKGSITRPATDRVRESIFNLIAARRSFDGTDVLDLFSGTGALGLEAISRGSRSATFVEIRRAVVKVSRENAERLGVSDKCSFYPRDAIRFLSSTDSQFDLVFADPPYDLERLGSLPGLVSLCMRKGGLFLLEHDNQFAFDEDPAWVESRQYGRTIVSIFRAIKLNQ